jgi:succinate dehydrogenase hydrophobic anchor subunit
MAVMLFWIIIYIVIGGVVFWGLQKILNEAPLPGLFKTVLNVLITIAMVVFIAYQLMPLIPVVTQAISHH